MAVVIDNTLAFGVYTQIASGVIANGSGPADVTWKGQKLTLAAGKDYLVYVANSNGGFQILPNRLLPDSVTIIAVVGSGAIIELSNYPLSSPLAQSEAMALQFRATGSASEQIAAMSVQDQALTDTTMLTIRQDGDIEALHTDGGGGTNGAWLVFERDADPARGQL